MKSEAQIISDLNSIVSKYIDSFTTDVISRRQKTVSSLDTVIAIVFKDKNISEDLLNDLIDYIVQSDRNRLHFETKKDIGNLDFEIIMISAEIFYGV